MSPSPTSRTEMNLLRELDAVGGCVDIDMHGQLMARQAPGKDGTLEPVRPATRRILPGSAATWLRVVAQGWVAGEDGKLFLTERARALL
jgi:hypothetical protein